MGDWRHRAACRKEDPELFFPVGTTGPALVQTQEAKAVCHRCPVASDCLAWALASGQEAGVWGGLDEDERRALRARLKRDRAAAAGSSALDAAESAANAEPPNPDSPGVAAGELAVPQMAEFPASGNS